MPTILTASDETRAIAALDALAERIYAETATIAHWGGDRPFDGVCDALFDRLQQLAGVQTADQIRKTRRRKVFGVRESLVIFRRDGYRCVTCGTDEDLTVDHIVAWSKGGTDEHDNLQTLCGSCNSRKGDR